MSSTFLIEETKKANPPAVPEPSTAEARIQSTLDGQIASINAAQKIRQEAAAKSAETARANAQRVRQGLALKTQGEVDLISRQRSNPIKAIGQFVRGETVGKARRDIQAGTALLQEAQISSVFDQRAIQAEANARLSPFVAQEQIVQMRKDARKLNNEDQRILLARQRLVLDVAGEKRIAVEKGRDRFFASLDSETAVDQLLTMQENGTESFQIEDATTGLSFDVTQGDLETVVTQKATQRNDLAVLQILRQQKDLELFESQQARLFPSLGIEQLLAAKENNNTVELGGQLFVYKAEELDKAIEQKNQDLISKAENFVAAPEIVSFKADVQRTAKDFQGVAERIQTTFGGQVPTEIEDLASDLFANLSESQTVIKLLIDNPSLRESNPGFPKQLENAAKENRLLLRKSVDVAATQFANGDKDLEALARAHIQQDPLAPAAVNAAFGTLALEQGNLVGVSSESTIAAVDAYRAEFLKIGNAEFAKAGKSLSETPEDMNTRLANLVFTGDPAKGKRIQEAVRQSALNKASAAAINVSRDRFLRFNDKWVGDLRLQKNGDLHPFVSEVNTAGIFERAEQLFQLDLEQRDISEKSPEAESLFFDRLLVQYAKTPLNDNVEFPTALDAFVDFVEQEDFGRVMTETLSESEGTIADGAVSRISGIQTANEVAKRINAMRSRAKQIQMQQQSLVEQNQASFRNDGISRLQQILTSDPKEALSESEIKKLLGGLKQQIQQARGLVRFIEPNLRGTNQEFDNALLRGTFEDPELERIRKVAAKRFEEIAPILDRQNRLTDIEAAIFSEGQ